MIYISFYVGSLDPLKQTVCCGKMVFYFVLLLFFSDVIAVKEYFVGKRSTFALSKMFPSHLSTIFTRH